MMGADALSEEVAEVVDDLPLSGIDFRDLRVAAQALARSEVSNAVVEALRADGRSLRQIQRDSGLDPAFVSKIANGDKGAGKERVEASSGGRTAVLTDYRSLELYRDGRLERVRDRRGCHPDHPRCGARRGVRA